MKTVPIDYLKAHFSFNPDAGIVTRTKDAQQLRRINDRGYVVVNWYKQIWKVHRIAWALYHGNWPEIDIDHINGDKTDNRITNLRLLSRSENVLYGKTRSDNTSGHRGIAFDASRNKWMVRFDRKFIGRYSTLEEAIKINRIIREGYNGHKT